MVLDDGTKMLSPEEYAAKFPSLHVAYCVFAMLNNVVLSILATVANCCAGEGGAVAATDFCGE